MGPIRNHDLYRSKLILAPMVRVCTLPMRLLSIDYGADLVYCEEIIDRKILMCQRIENELLGTTDFTLSDGTVVFRTCPREKEKLIFQVGTSDSKRALAAAKKIQDCVAGVDVNMGCPKEFSIKGGMGAALLSQPEKVREILTTLVNGLDVPVSCKIRVLPTIDATVNLAKLIESTGVSALAVHGRTKEERSRDPNRDEYIKAVAQAVGIPVIANGGSRSITSLADVQTFRKSTNCSSIMLARAAEWNCSIFRPEGRLPFDQVIRSYLRYAFQFDNNEMNTKYCILQILHDKMTEVPQADPSLAAKSLDDFAAIWDLKEEYENILRRRDELKEEVNAQHGSGIFGVKRRKTEEGLTLVELPVRYNKRLYSNTMTPKQILNNLCKKHKKSVPIYTTVERPEDRCFHSTLLYDERKYTNPYWEKSKALAEQSAAICCLVAIGEHDGRLSEPLHENEELRRKWRETLASDDFTTVAFGEVTNAGAQEKDTGNNKDSGS